MTSFNKICIVFTGIVFLVSFGKNDGVFLPNLPVGDFRIYYKAMEKCNSNPNSPIQQNYYLNKVSSNRTELRGNLTLKIPIDDSLTVHFNWAVKDSIGGWKENAHVLNSPKGCTTFKHFMGPNWSQLYSSMGFNNTDCPLSPGVYILNGYPLRNTVAQTNFMKSFFYGTYKVRVYFTDNSKTQYGCVAYIVELKRPWETD